MPGDSGVTVVTNSCAFYTCTRGCGRIARPAFPAPSLEGRVRPRLKGQEAISKTRATRGEIAKMCLKRYPRNTIVMPGLDPGIHPSRKNIFEKEMDCRVKPGNDGRCSEIGCLKIQIGKQTRCRPGLEPEPITTNVHRCAKLGPQLVNNWCRWLWVPAFAGTTYRRHHPRRRISSIRRRPRRNRKAAAYWMPRLTRPFLARRRDT
jgi:hypothetical protein